MEYRDFGNTGMRISALGFGCGAVGGLMVRGEHRDMLRSVKLALDSGINYYDTARMYGEGLSEMHTGAVLRELHASDAIVGTKVRIDPPDFADLQSAVARHIEGSLLRLGMDTVDIIYTHNPIGNTSVPDRGVLSLDDLGQIATAFERAVEQGKLRFWGFNGLGDTEAIQKAIDTYKPSGIHTAFNMLNPTTGYPAPGGYPYQDYGEVMNRAAAQGTGTVAIRILAGGALSGSMERHPVAAQGVAPIGTGRTMEEDLARTEAFRFLVDDGYADSLVEASIRFVLNSPALSTALVGIASYDQIETAIQAANKGPLSQEAIDRIKGVWMAM
jgi:L-galactose dehydrogenase/L-glyceraldehyde 3-phosphate reductase